MELSLHTGFQLATPPFQPSCFACQNALTQDVHNPWPGKCGTGKGYLGIRWGVYFGAAALGWVDGCRNPNRTRGGVVDPGRDRLTESTEEDPPFRPRGRMISIALEFLYDPICINIYWIYYFFSSLLFCAHEWASLGLKQLGSRCCPMSCPHLLFSALLASNPFVLASACAWHCWQKSFRPFRQRRRELWPFHWPSGCHCSFQHFVWAMATSLSLEECLRCLLLQFWQTT